MNKSFVVKAAEWATFLVELGLTIKQAEAALAYRILHSLKIGIPEEGIMFAFDGHTLWGAFVFDETPEGHNYWVALARWMEDNDHA